MQELLDKAKDELKRTDHLIYVSLKYTRTVDVLKSIIQRLVNCFEFGVDSLLKFLLENKKIKEVPGSHKFKIDLLLQQYATDEQMQDFLKLYTELRKINRATYTKREEFRRHVTMVAAMDDGSFKEITMDLVKEYNEKAIAFLNYIDVLMFGEKND